MRCAHAISVTIISLTFLVGAYIAHIYYEQPRTSETFTDNYDLVLKDYAGKDIALSQFKRTILVAHSWASWCTYCAEELQNLSRLKEIYGDDIRVLAVNRAESAQEAEVFSAPLNLGEGIEITLDSEDAFYKKIGGYAMPETVFINEKGEIIYHQRGPMKLNEVIDALKIVLENN